jgi:hypothetical protein
MVSPWGLLTSQLFPALPAGPLGCSEPWPTLAWVVSPPELWGPATGLLLVPGSELSPSVLPAECQ